MSDITTERRGYGGRRTASRYRKKPKRRVYSPTRAAYPTPKPKPPRVYSPTRAAYPTPKRPPPRKVAGPPTPSPAKLRRIRAENERAAARRRARTQERYYKSQARHVATRARDQPIERRALAQERYLSTYPKPKPATPVFAARGVLIPGLTREQQERQSIGETEAVKRYVKAPALKGLEQLARPIHGVAGGARAGIRGENVLTGAARGVTLKDRYLMSDVLSELGWDPKSGEGKAARGVVGFLLDVGLDPLTYVTGGMSSVARQGAVKSGALRGASAARGKLRELAPEVAAGNLSKREAQRVAKAAGRQAAGREMKRRATTGKQADRGLTVGIAGPRQARAAVEAVGRRRTLGREVRAVKRGRPRPVVRRPGKVRRAVRGRPVAAPLIRTTAALSRSQRAGLERAFGKRGVQVGKAARNVAADLHAGIRPADVSRAEQAQIKAIRRESRAEAERLMRRSSARANALMGKLDKDDQRLVLDAIEADNLRSLPSKLREIATQVRSELDYRKRIERRAGTLAGQVGRKSRTPAEVARSGAAIQAPRVGQYERRFTEAVTARKRLELAPPTVRREAVARVPADTQRVGQAEHRVRKMEEIQHEAALEVAQERRLVDDGQEMYRDFKARGLNAAPIERRLADAVDRLEYKEANLERASDAVKQARKDLRRERRESHRVVEREVLVRPVERPVTQRELKRARQAERRAGKRLAKVRGRQAAAESGRAELRAMRRERLAGQAQGYFPRISEVETRKQGLVAQLAEPELQLPQRMGAAKPRPGPSKRREQRKPLAAMREGTEEEVIRAAQVSEDPRLAVATRGVKAARGVQSANLNRKLVQTLGEPVPPGVTARTMQQLDEQGFGIYRLRRGDLERLDLDDLPEIIRNALWPEERGPTGANVPRLQLKQKGETRPGVEAGAGRYVILRDRVVDRVRAGEGGKVTPAGNVWDAANRGFKSIALMTPAYLVRNFTGDLFNAFTREQAFRLVFNVGRGQRVLQALGKAERAQRRRDLGKGQQAMRELGRLRTAGNRLARMLTPGLREIKLTSEQAREIAGPSADRLYQVIRRGNPELSKDQIRAQIERNLSAGKIPALHLAQLAEQAGVVRQGRFLELMQEGRPTVEARAKGRGPWNELTKRVEDSVRVATFLGGLRRGMSVREAADRTSVVHFDYGDLSVAEKRAFRRLMPFYTFPSRNIPFQARSLVSRPGKYATVQKLREEAARAGGFPEGWEENLPEWEQRQLGVPIRLPMFLGGERVTVSLGSPFTDVNDVIGFGRGVAAIPRTLAGQDTGTDVLGAATVPMRRFMEMLTPAKIALELPLNTSFFFREDISPEGRTLTKAPGWAIKAASLPNVGDEFRASTGMQRKGKLWMWDKRAEYALRSAKPGLIGLVGEIAGAVVPGGARETGRGRTQAQRLIGLAGPRVSTYDPEQGRVNRLYEQAEEVDRRTSEKRQLAKEQAKAEGREATEEEWQTPGYERLLAQRRRIQDQIDAGEEPAVTPSRVLVPPRAPRTRARAAPRRLLVPPASSR